MKHKATEKHRKISPKTLPKPFSCGGRRKERRGREEVEFSEIRGETNALLFI